MATDLNPDVMLPAAVRAARKSSRGGVTNLLCIAESTETLAENLAGVANRVTVILPWGSLLRGVALPEVSPLASLHRLCAPDAAVEIVMSVDKQRDAGQQNRLGLAILDELHVRSTLTDAYARAGFRVICAETILSSELRAYETTWARRLAFGRPREIWRLRLAKTLNPEFLAQPACPEAPETPASPGSTLRPE